MDLTYISLHNNQTYEFTILVKRPSDCVHPCVYTGKATGWQIKRLIEMRDLYGSRIDPNIPVVIPHEDGTIRKQTQLKEICRMYHENNNNNNNEEDTLSNETKASPPRKRIRSSCIIL